MEEKNLNTASPVEELDLSEILTIRREKLEALKRVNETSSYLTDRLKEYGFNVAPIKARLGTIYPPNTTKTTENNITRTRQNNDGLSVDI